MALSDRIPYLAQVDRPKLTLPGGKKLAVWIILNVEEWRIENAHAAHGAESTDGSVSRCCRTGRTGHGN